MNNNTLDQIWNKTWDEINEIIEIIDNKIRNGIFSKTDTLSNKIWFKAHTVIRNKVRDDNSEILVLLKLTLAEYFNEIPN